MEDLRSKSNSIINSIYNLVNSDYSLIIGKNIYKVLDDFYPVFHEEIYRHRNTSKINKIYSSIIKTNPSDKPVIDKYLSMVFPITIDENVIKVIKTNNGTSKSKKILIKKLDYKEKLFYPGEFINFTTYKFIWDKFGTIDKRQIDALIELFGSVEKLSELLKKSLKWPSTDIAISIQSIFKTGWVSSGLLSAEGYHVGNIGLDIESRKILLKEILFKDFEQEHDYMDEYYINSWSEPGTLTRLIKLARTIAALCRNAKRSSHDYTNAINDWESDLAYLKTEFYEPWIQKEAIGQAIEQLKWPETAV